MFYKDFYHREMWYLNTSENTIFLHVKISIISLTSGLSLKLYLNSLVYHRNIFESSSKVLGNLRKFSENVRERSSGLRDNLKSLRKSSENHQKRSHQYVYIIKTILHVSSKIWILCSRGKSNISIPHFAVPDGFRRVKFSQEYFRKFFVTWVKKKLLHHCCGTWQW